MGGGEASYPGFFLAARRQGRAVGFLEERVAGVQPPYRYGLRAAVGFIHSLRIHSPKTERSIVRANDSVA